MELKFPVASYHIDREVRVSKIKIMRNIFYLRNIFGVIMSTGSGEEIANGLLLGYNLCQNKFACYCSWQATMIWS